MDTGNENGQEAQDQNEINHAGGDELISGQGGQQLNGTNQGGNKPKYTEANKVRITTPYLTKYERARILGTRALQIRFVPWFDPGVCATLICRFHSMNAPVLVPLEGETDALAIAIKELSQKKIPLKIRRFLPDGSWEEWSIQVRASSPIQKETT